MCDDDVTDGAGARRPYVSVHQQRPHMGTTEPIGGISGRCTSVTCMAGLRSVLSTAGSRLYMLDLRARIRRRRDMWTWAIAQGVHTLVVISAGSGLSDASWLEALILWLVVWAGSRWILTMNIGMGTKWPRRLYGGASDSAEK